MRGPTTLTGSWLLAASSPSLPASHTPPLRPPVVPVVHFPRRALSSVPLQRQGSSRSFERLPSAALACPRTRGSPSLSRVTPHLACLSAPCAAKDGAPLRKLRTHPTGSCWAWTAWRTAVNLVLEGRRGPLEVPTCTHSDAARPCASVRDVSSPFRPQAHVDVLAALSAVSFWGRTGVTSAAELESVKSVLSRAAASPGTDSRAPLRGGVLTGRGSAVSEISLSDAIGGDLYALDALPLDEDTHQLRQDAVACSTKRWRRVGTGVRGLVGMQDGWGREVAERSLTLKDVPAAGLDTATVHVIKIGTIVDLIRCIPSIQYLGIHGSWLRISADSTPTDPLLVPRLHTLHTKIPRGTGVLLSSLSLAPDTATLKSLTLEFSSDLEHVEEFLRRAGSELESFALSISPSINEAQTITRLIRHTPKLQKLKFSISRTHLFTIDIVLTRTERGNIPWGEIDTALADARFDTLRRFDFIRCTVSGRPAVMIGPASRRLMLSATARGILA
ncbi:hypothetical protein B0H19DRAFT_1271655 [Mycena capillaripes]|nr:hypothetical protein B0H19DRAFT_1271655 [Mycena capillaripes]